MSAGTTRISDLIVPQIFTPYVQNRTEQKSRFVQSGILARDFSIDTLLNGGGLTFELPSFKDLDNDEERVSTDNPADVATHNKIGTLQQTAVRLNRNQSWTTMDLAAVLAGADPMSAIGDLVSDYWMRRQQTILIATLMGVFADNEAAPAGGDTHTLNDLTANVSGGAYVAGVTNFTTEAFIDAVLTMGDSMDTLGLVLVHSVVFARMQKNNLIDFIPDSEGRVNIPTFLGRRVIIDDGVPNPAGVGAAQTAAGIYHTLVAGPGAFRWGVGQPKVPTEMDRIPGVGNGSGQEVLYNRVEWCIHPAGYRYVGTAASGGPSNAATANNLAAAASWSRCFPERKQIKLARLITRES